MKKLITSLKLAMIVACPFASFAQASIESDPAYLPIDKAIDLKAIPPQVNVNLPHFLLKDALSGLTNGPADFFGGAGIDLADLVKDVKLIRVVLLEAAKTNRTAVDKAVKSLRTELDAKWTSIVSVPEEKDTVGIYAMGDASGESVAGLAVLIADGSDVVIVNIVGHVSVGKLIKLAAQSNKLPKDLLKKLTGISDHPGQQPAPKKDKISDVPKTKSPMEAPEPAKKETAEK